FARSSVAAIPMGGTFMVVVVVPVLRSVLQEQHDRHAVTAMRRKGFMVFKWVRLPGQHRLDDARDSIHPDIQLREKPDAADHGRPCTHGVATRMIPENCDASKDRDSRGGLWKEDP